MSYRDGSTAVTEIGANDRRFVQVALAAAPHEQQLKLIPRQLILVPKKAQGVAY
jgi:hypothetical protein